MNKDKFVTYVDLLVQTSRLYDNSLTVKQLYTKEEFIEPLARRVFSPASVHLLKSDPDPEAYTIFKKKFESEIYPRFYKLAWCQEMADLLNNT